MQTYTHSACLCQCLCVISGLCLCRLRRAQFGWGLLCLSSVVYSVLLHFVAVSTLRSMPSGCSAVRVLRACLRGRSVAGVGCVGGVGSIVYVLCTCCRLCASCCVLHPTHRTHSAHTSLPLSLHTSRDINPEEPTNMSVLSAFECTHRAL